MSESLSSNSSSANGGRGPGVISGVITAMATVFDAAGEIDAPATAALARFLVDNGSHGVVVSGTTGESPTLDDDEKLALLAAVVEEIGDEALVVAGTGSNDTRHTVELTAASVEAGAHAVLVVTPYYNKPNAAGVKAHFLAAAEAAGETPVILYNIPARCVVNVSPAELEALAAARENIVAVKQANNDEIQALDGLDVLAGNDEVFLETLQAGGTGGILVSSHLAGPQMRRLYESFIAGDTEEAATIDAALAPVYAAMGVTTNPIPVKAALTMTGTTANGVMRLPMVEATEAERAAIRAALDAAGIATQGSLS